MIIVGIDPGLKGGIAVFEDGKLSKVKAMPTFEEKSMDFGSIVEDLRAADAVVLEEQFIKPTGGMAQRGMAKTMRNFGNLEGILRGLGVPHQVVKSQLWKGKVLKGTAKDKTAAIAYVQARYPAVSLMAKPRSRVPSDGMAEAVCIGEYGLSLEWSSTQ